MIIRRARKSDFPFVYPILKQIFDEMQMKSIHILERQQKNGQNFEGVTWIGYNKVDKKVKELVQL